MRKRPGIVNRSAAITRMVGAMRGSHACCEEAKNKLALSKNRDLYRPGFTESLLQTTGRSKVAATVRDVKYTPCDAVRRVLPCLSRCLLSVGRVGPRGRGRFAKHSGRLVLRGTGGVTSSRVARLDVHIPIVPKFGSARLRVHSVTTCIHGLNGIEEVRLLPCRELKRSGCSKLGHPCLVKSMGPPAGRGVRQLLGMTRRISNMRYQVNNWGWGARSSGLRRIRGERGDRGGRGGRRGRQLFGLAGIKLYNGVDWRAARGGDFSAVPEEEGGTGQVQGRGEGI